MAANGDCSSCAASAIVSSSARRCLRWRRAMIAARPALAAMLTTSQGQALF
jgi:hypothetical protein